MVGKRRRSRALMLLWRFGCFIVDVWGCIDVELFYFFCCCCADGAIFYPFIILLHTPNDDDYRHCCFFDVVAIRDEIKKEVSAELQKKSIDSNKAI